jgi:hypothetical protein
MKKPNYGFLKRKKEMKQKQKQEEKRLRRLGKAPGAAGDGTAGNGETGPVQQ